jgi:hypothetical protein
MYRMDNETYFRALHGHFVLDDRVLIRVYMLPVLF